MKDIYYKGYNLYYNECDDCFIAKVFGRENGRFSCFGKTKEKAIEKLKKEIDKVRNI